MPSVRTLVVGNSVSGQKAGYVRALADQHPELGLEHGFHVCIGGVGTIGLLALAGDLLGDVQAELVLIETSLMDAGGGTLFEDIPWALRHLIESLRKVSTNIVLLHLPRFDVDQRNLDTVVNAQNRVAEHVKAGIIDARPTITRAHTSDGLHLTAEGGAELAAFLAPALVALLEQPVRVIHESDEIDQAQYLPVRAAMWHAPTAQKASFRATVPTLRLKAGLQATVRLDGATPLTVLCIAGPTSGVVEMRSPRGSALLQLWDPWCEFRRVQIMHVPPRLREPGWLALGPMSVDEAEFDAAGKPATRVHRGSILELVGVMTRGPVED